VAKNVEGETESLEVGERLLVMFHRDHERGRESREVRQRNDAPGHGWLPGYYQLIRLH